MSATRLAVLLDAVEDPDWMTALACGIHPNSLSRYRTGARAITNKHALALAAYLEVSVDDIRGKADDAWLEDLISRRQNA